MKLSLTLAVAAIAASVAAPALADEASTRFAVNQFNQSADTSSDLIANGPNGAVLGTTVSSMGGNPLGAAIEHFNASRDTAANRISADTVTVFSGEPAHAADIFEQLRLADDDN